MRPVAAALVAAFLLAASHSTAGAFICAPRAAAVAHLEQKFGEAKVVVAVTNDGNLFEIFANRTTGSFSVLVTMPNGVACLALAGDGWQEVNRGKRARGG
ncbi:MAG: hypothetical protein V3S88_06295 [Alphaproteobacteria bacterium]